MAVIGCSALMVLAGGTASASAQSIYDMLFGGNQPSPPPNQKSKKSSSWKKSVPKVSKKKPTSRSGLGAGTSTHVVTPDPPTKKNNSLVHKAAQQSDLTISSVDGILTLLAGEPGQTSLQLAHDLAVVVEDKAKMRLLPMVGRGGVRNVKDLLSHSGIDLTITYVDILAEIGADQGLKKAYGSKIKPVAKLCNAELHIVAGEKIEDITQLDGRPVNFGPEGSASQFTARRIFAQLGIAPTELSLFTKDAIAKLKTEEIAATVILAGKPTSLLTGISRTDGLKVLSIPYLDSFPAHYLPSRITSADYPQLVDPAGNGIDTVAVGAILVARNPDKEDKREQRLTSFVKTFFQHLDQLRVPPRHPKWHETTLSAPVAGWTRLAVATDILSKLQKSNATVSNAVVINEQSNDSGNPKSAKPASSDPQQKLLKTLTQHNPQTKNKSHDGTTQSDTARPNGSER